MDINIKLPLNCPACGGPHGLKYQIAEHAYVCDYCGSAFAATGKPISLGQASKAGYSVPKDTTISSVPEVDTKAPWWLRLVLYLIMFGIPVGVAALVTYLLGYGLLDIFAPGLAWYQRGILIMPAGVAFLVTVSLVLTVLTSGNSDKE